MRMTNRAWVLTFACLALPLSTAAELSPNASNADEILRASFERSTGNKVIERLKMTISDSRGRERVRVLRRRSMKFKTDERTLLQFESPGDLRNTGLLTIDHDDAKKDPDQWLFLPGLGRVTRIASKRRSGSFVGSDLSYADLTTPDPGDYNARLVSANETIDGTDCWHLEVTPKTKAEQDATGYSKIELWISKASLVPVRVKAAMKGARLKYISFSGVRQMQGVWTTKKVVARTVREGKLQSQTVLEQLEVAFDQKSVTEADFTVHRLEQGL